MDKANRCRSLSRSFVFDLGPRGWINGAAKGESLRAGATIAAMPQSCIVRSSVLAPRDRDPDRSAETALAVLRVERPRDRQPL
jgi:hypothetical protein